MSSSSLSSSFGCVTFAILFLFCISKIHAEFTNVFNIKQFGAKADGVTDSSLALSNAWSKACKSEKPSVVLVPKGSFLVLPVLLQGPCNGDYSIKLQIDGTLMASADKSQAFGDHWIKINSVNNLIIDGHGSLDGQGPSAWPFNNCSPPYSTCSSLPVTLRLNSINNAAIRNIKSINSKFFHFAVYQSRSVTFDSVRITAPADSPNTDGIHIGKSTDITVMNSVIGTGDDCISLGPGSKTINISNVQCGPGHGISIGSLGHFKDEDDVVGVVVRHSSFTGTDNGVRIKTWSSSYPSLVSDITFLHLTMDNVENPILIDQNYCPHDSCNSKDGESGSRVKIRGVRYEDIRGTSKSENAVNFSCSKSAPCEKIVLQDINLAINGGDQGRKSATSTCSNVVGLAYGVELPPPCF